MSKTYNKTVTISGLKPNDRFMVNDNRVFEIKSMRGQKAVVQIIRPFSKDEFETSIDTKVRVKGGSNV